MLSSGQGLTTTLTTSQQLWLVTCTKPAQDQAIWKSVLYTSPSLAVDSSSEGKIILFRRKQSWEGYMLEEYEDMEGGKWDWMYFTVYMHNLLENKNIIP